MRILFVYKGYGVDCENPVVLEQYNSLIKENIHVELFPIKLSNITGYLIEFIRLFKLLRRNKFDIIHAHYSYCGFLAGLFPKKKVVCSLMGSDVFSQSKHIAFITRFFYEKIWEAVICKSKQMKDLYQKSNLIPNGVDFDAIFPITKKEAIIKTDLLKEKSNILFIALNPTSEVKNVQLAKEAVKLLQNSDIVLNIICDKSKKELVYYYNSADLLVLTSLSEGSPNVIKEAMACNLPIVSTDVGDVKEIIQETEGCYITSFDPEEISKCILKAINYGKRTNGRENINQLDDKKIAKKIIEVYETVLNE